MLRGRVVGLQATYAVCLWLDMPKLLRDVRVLPLVPEGPWYVELQEVPTIAARSFQHSCDRSGTGVRRGSATELQGLPLMPDAHSEGRWVQFYGLPKLPSTLLLELRKSVEILAPEARL